MIYTQSGRPDKQMQAAMARSWTGVFHIFITPFTYTDTKWRVNCGNKLFHPRDGPSLRQIQTPSYLTLPEAAFGIMLTTRNWPIAR